MTALIDLAALRATAEIEKERSDLIFAGFGRGEEEIDQGDVRARDLAYGVLALLDRLERAEAVCEVADNTMAWPQLRKALDAWRTDRVPQ